MDLKQPWRVAVAVLIRWTLNPDPGDTMRNLLITCSVAATLVLAMATQADASCSGRKTTGTILGGLGGALLGNTISHGGGGAVIGGVGGAVVGHQIGKDGCARPTAYRAPVRRRVVHRAPVRTAYYDSHGHRIYR